MNKIRKKTIKVPAIRINQRPPDLLDYPEFIKESDFFIFSLSSSELLKVAKFLGRKESSLGVQRDHKEDRDREIGRFITSDHPFFPNTIIINIPIDFDDSFYDPENNILKFTIPEESAYIIDGQHRLKAFASSYSKGCSLNLVVSAYFGLELPTIAEIFTRINFYQKPVNKSLVYDLLDLNSDPDFSRFRIAHNMASLLNDTIGSPFYSKIKMLGVGSGLISQASFVEALSTRYKIIDILSNCDLLEKQIMWVIDNYFKAAVNSFSNNDYESDFIFSSSLTFNAFVKILGLILQKQANKKQILQLDFYQYTDVMAKSKIDFKLLKSFGGFKGVKALVDIFITALEWEDLL